MLSDIFIVGQDYDIEVKSPSVTLTLTANIIMIDDKKNEIITNYFRLVVDPKYVKGTKK